MADTTSSDLPPAYYTLTLSPEELSVNIESHDIEPFIGNSFENKNVRIIFTLKVLSIFLLQTVAVGIVLGIFGCSRIFIISDLIGVALVAYLITALVMVYMDQVQIRSIYNYVILVYYPFMVTFVITMLPTLIYGHDWRGQLKLRETFFSAWVSYTVAVFVIFFHCVFSLLSKYEFKLRTKMFIAAFAFVASYICNTIPLYFILDITDPFHVIYVTIFLYLCHLYVMYDIDVMTGSNYRSKITPDDYVTAAVNLQIDFLFILMDFIKKTRCGDDDEE